MPVLANIVLPGALHPPGFLGLAFDPGGEWPVFLYVLLAVILVLGVGRRLLDRHVRSAPGGKFRAQIIQLGLALAAVLAILLVIPLKEPGLRGTILTTLGVVLSAAIALSSTTFLGNLLAGLMLRSLRNFRRGDFLRCGEHFGRVTERGLFHTEIQTEDRDLTTLPNLVLATRPFTVLRDSGTIVSATVSLGYDAPRARVRALLLEAAAEAGLVEPFVQVNELGDDAVVYRVAGLLTEVKTLLSTRSRLRGLMMDHLHGGGVEIVSPAFMNTRALSPSARIIPRRAAAEVPADDGPTVEELVFDKAELARSVDDLTRARDGFRAEKAAAEERLARSKDEAERAELTAEIERLEGRIARQEVLLRRRDERLHEEDDPPAP